MFRQRIGIWYKYKIDMERIFNIIKKYYKENIARVRTGQIFLKNGDSILFLRATENQRGQALTDSFIVGDIDEDAVKCIIAPCTKIGGRGLWKIDMEIRQSDEDIIHQFMYRKPFW